MVRIMLAGFLACISLATKGRGFHFNASEIEKIKRERPGGESGGESKSAEYAINHYRRNKGYVAEITDTDPKYGLKRDFLDPYRSTRSSSGNTGTDYHRLEEGKIYEIKDSYGDRKRLHTVKDGELQPISRDEALKRLGKGPTPQESAQMESLPEITDGTDKQNKFASDVRGRFARTLRKAYEDAMNHPQLPEEHKGKTFGQFLDAQGPMGDALKKALGRSDYRFWLDVVRGEENSVPQIVGSKKFRDYFNLSDVVLSDVIRTVRAYDLSERLAARGMEEKKAMSVALAERANL